MRRQHLERWARVVVARERATHPALRVRDLARQRLDVRPRVDLLQRVVVRERDHTGVPRGRVRRSGPGQLVALRRRPFLVTPPPFPLTVVFAMMIDFIAEGPPRLSLLVLGQQQPEYFASDVRRHAQPRLPPGAERDSGGILSESVCRGRRWAASVLHGPSSARSHPSAAAIGASISSLGW
jgi:hypothetical protein